MGEPGKRVVETQAALAVIGVDWGSTSLRVYGMDAGGAIVRRHEGHEGILALPADRFGAHLESLLAPWLRHARPPPILLSGMITSRQGWQETPYLACPAPVSALARALHPARSPSGWPLHFITGLRCCRSGGIPDVMRGEETQVVGAGLDDGLLVMPGTHSKWVRLHDRAVHGFTTFMTGEVFQNLREHSILGRLMDGAADDAAAFDRGVDAGIDAAAGLLSQLFSVRSLGLFGDVPAQGLAAYLSGLLIGNEFKEGLAAYRGEARSLTLLGRGALVDRYARAAARAGIGTIAGPPDSAARGHLLIARAAGLLQC